MIQTIPLWLKEIKPAACLCCEIGRKKGLVDRAVASITSLLRDIFISDELAAKNGFIQNIDPRVKIITLLIFILFVSFMRSFTPLLLTLIFIILIAHLSQISISSLFKRVMPVMIFTGIIALPSVLNVFIPGRDILTILNTDSIRITVTDMGIRTASLFVLRVGIMTSIATLLFLTTKKNDLLKGLRAFFIPQMFITALAFTFRYIFIFLKIMEDMHLARKSRVIGQSKTGEFRAWAASRIGVLFKKTMTMAQDVYFAMASRGFTGDIKTLGGYKIQKIDYLWIGILSFFILITKRL